ncbi:MAG: phage tail protein [Xylophilus sp.]|nr:phage tail protein [Xylophilus sp.]
MAVSLPNGVTFALATAYGAVKAISAITNVNPGVASAAAHGFSDGDFVEITSGWSRLNNRVVRVDAPTTDAFNVEGINTTSTLNYPSGTGGGSAREITQWTQISQIMELSTSGGEMQFTTYSFLEQDFESQLPTQSSAMTITMGIADDPALAGYQALKSLADTRELVALKATMPNGSVILYNGYVSFNETPTMTKNSVMVVNATFSLQGRPVRYAA